jgi:methyl-accepting chemotaxis protein
MMGSDVIQIVSDIDVGVNGYAYMFNTQGVLVAHRNRDFVMGQFNPIKLGKDNSTLKSWGLALEQATTQQNYFTSYDLEEGTYYAGFSPVLGTSWFTVVSIPVTEALSGLYILRTRMILISLIFVIASLVLVFWLSKKFTQPIEQISKTCEQLAETGNLSLRVNVQTDDELGLMALSLNNLLNNILTPINQLGVAAKKIVSGDLTTQIDVQAKGDVVELVHSFKQLVEHLKTFVIGVDGVVTLTSSAAKGLSDSAEEVNSSMEQIALTIQEVAKGAQIVSEKSSKAQEIANKTKESSLQGAKSAQVVDELMKNIDESTKKGVTKVTSLGEQSKNISDIVNTIQNISEQTNLLALNAAIEAARAGEAGKGFAVVADEVRKLAEESHIASGRIAELIQHITAEIEDAVMTMNANSQAVASGGSGVSKALQSFDEIPKLVELVTTDLVNMANAAQENAAGSQEVSASSEEISASMAQISKAAQDLVLETEKLKKLSSKFKL